MFQHLQAHPPEGQGKYWDELSNEDQNSILEGHPACVVARIVEETTTLSPAVMDLINADKVSFTIDQQQRLQGYMPVIVLHLYNNAAGLLPGANIPSGPGFVDKSNASSVSALAGIDR